MKTLKDLKAAVANAAYMTITDTDKQHKYLNVKRRVHHVNTVGFGLEPLEGGRISYLDWPKASELTFYPGEPNSFRIDCEHVMLAYTIEPKA